MEPAVEGKVSGAFVESLKRTNKEIKHDRADMIAEDAQLLYKRTIEDMEMDLKNLVRKRTAMLDLSPTNSQSLMLAGDFRSKEFVEQDLNVGLEMRNIEIKLEIAKKQYEYLFGGN